MEEEGIEVKAQKVSKIKRIVVTIYYVLVCTTGIYYAIKSHGGNLATIIAI